MTKKPRDAALRISQEICDNTLAAIRQTIREPNIGVQNRDFIKYIVAYRLRHEFDLILRHAEARGTPLLKIAREAAFGKEY